jgi:hypothetical protein
MIDCTIGVYPGQLDGVRDGCMIESVAMLKFKVVYLAQIVTVIFVDYHHVAI